MKWCALFDGVVVMWSVDLPSSRGSICGPLGKTYNSLLVLVKTNLESEIIERGGG